jgi:hypothetical protein
MVYFYLYIKTAREFGLEKLARHLIFFLLTNHEDDIVNKPDKNSPYKNIKVKSEGGSTIDLNKKSY